MMKMGAFLFFLKRKNEGLGCPNQGKYLCVNTSGYT